MKGLSIIPFHFSSLAYSWMKSSSLIRVAYLKHQCLHLFSFISFTLFRSYVSYCWILLVKHTFQPIKKLFSRLRYARVWTCACACVCVYVSKLSIKCEWITGPYNYDRPMLFTFALGKVKSSARTSISHHRRPKKKKFAFRKFVRLSDLVKYTFFLVAAFVFLASMSFDIRSGISKMIKILKVREEVQNQRAKRSASFIIL